MFGRRIELFTLLGFKVRIEASWVVIAVLVVWSLAVGYFPAAVPGLQAASYWWLGALGAIGLFASIVFHEFAHAMVARRFGMPIAGVTLFIFGGVAELEDEPPSAAAEFWVAIAGPISSYLLAVAFYAVALTGEAAGAAAPVLAVLIYLALINVVLATFNLLPAFPLDGGRVLRAALWWWTSDAVRATRISALLGRVLGSLLIAIGLFGIISGNFVGGMWQALIGFFIIGASGMSRMQMELRIGLGDTRVRDLMRRDPVTVPADISVAELVDSYFYRHFHKEFPVVRERSVVGCVRLRDVGKVERDRWASVRVADIVEPDSASRTVRSDAPVLEAFKVMQKAGSGRIMVIDEGRLIGMLTMRDVMNFLTVRLELESRSSAAQRPGDEQLAR